MRRGVGLIVIVVTLLGIYLYLQTPRLDRDWDEDVAVLASIDIEPDQSGFTIRNLRDWRYDKDGAISKSYITRNYRLADLQAMYLYEQILDGQGLIAHTFVVFEFHQRGKVERLGVSVETRRERGEQYSLIKGAMRGFELTHTWATERDLIERRVTYLRYSLSRYRVIHPPMHQREYLLAFFRETRELATAPRWYNTLFSNCTNVLIDTAKKIQPKAFDLDVAYILTGWADEYLVERGILSEAPPDFITESNVLKIFSETN